WWWMGEHYISPTIGSTYAVRFNDRAGPHVPWVWIESGQDNSIGELLRVRVANSSNPSVNELDSRMLDPHQYFYHSIGTPRVFTAYYRGQALYDYTIVGSGVELEGGERLGLRIEFINEIDDHPQTRIEWEGAGLSVY